MSLNEYDLSNEEWLNKETDSLLSQSHCRIKLREEERMLEKRISLVRNP